MASQILAWNDEYTRTHTHSKAHITPVCCSNLPRDPRCTCITFVAVALMFALLASCCICVYVPQLCHWWDDLESLAHIYHYKGTLLKPTLSCANTRRAKTNIRYVKTTVRNINLNSKHLIKYSWWKLPDIYSFNMCALYAQQDVMWSHTELLI